MELKAIGFDLASSYYVLRNRGDAGSAHYCSNRRSDDPCTASIIALGKRCLQGPSVGLILKLERARNCLAHVFVCRAFNKNEYVQALGEVYTRGMWKGCTREDFPEAVKLHALSVAMELFRQGPKRGPSKW